MMKYYKEMKTSAVILFWQFSTGLLFNIFLRPTGYFQLFNFYVGSIVAIVVCCAFLFSPLAGFVADVKLGRLRALILGSSVMVLSITLISTLLIILAITDDRHFFIGVSLLLGVAFLLYCLGQVTFLSNIIQFATDQLQDAPTRCTVSFIQLYFWFDSLSYLITGSIYIPIDKVYTVHKNKFMFDRVRSSLIGVILGFSAISTLLVSIFLHKYKNQIFIRRVNSKNPYNLVYNVIQFALRHNKPIRRSAFTFCDDHRPSRLDFGKLRYGGPYTTEEVEDVKVMLHILKVLLVLGPVFMLEGAACYSYLQLHETNDANSINFSSLFLQCGLLVPLLTLIFIPSVQLLLKPLLSKYYPNMFKRMGINLIILTLSFFLYTLQDTLAYSGSDSASKICSRNSSYTLNKSYIKIPNSYLSVVQLAALAAHLTLLYTSTCEFICSQSPQYMKGLMYGLFYALRSFYQLLAIVIVIPFVYVWDTDVMSGCSGYYIMNFCIGLIACIIYVIVSKNYQWRKRDDICNIYQFAENYYLTYGTN